MNLFPYTVASSLVLAAVLWAHANDPSERMKLEPVAREFGAPCEVLWREWRPGLAEEERAKGNVVWLSFTTEWDLASMINELRVNSDDLVVEMLGRHRVVLIKADGTMYDPEIGREFSKYGRGVIPTNILMPADLEAEVVILPELLTSESVLEGLEKVVVEGG